MVESISANHLSGTDRIRNTYSFASELLSSVRSHTVAAVTTTIVSSYEYDHIGRKLTSKSNINALGDIWLSRLAYNGISQLKQKELHSSDGTTFLQSTKLAYNERGWLKNNASAQFSFKLGYDTLSSPQYNGNISTQLWGSAYGNRFNYEYDRLNRLTNGTSTGIVMSEALSYDKMGNIVSMNRDAAGVASYSYTGNKLTSITGGGLTTGTYAYDANGNATTDGRTGVALTYNYLNLPSTASKSGLNLAYTYTADGRKLKKVSTTSGTTTTDYVDGIQYTNGVIDFIQTEEGIIRKNGATYTYEYNLTDHLGNVRYTFYKNPTTGALQELQSDNYYTFGLRKVVNAGTNKYLYNGKELQDELVQYDYGARFYDPVIGRWNVVDPLAEQMRRHSPYNYGFNNPIRFVDPDGMGPNDFVKRGDNSIYWDNNANSQASTKSGETYLGKTLKFEFNSYIDGKLWDGPTMGGLIDPSGDKLTSTVTLNASENENGELTGLSASKSVKLGDTPFGEARGYYPGEGGSNNILTKSTTAQGTNINFEQHGSVSRPEEFSLNAIGYKIVDVAQKLNINYNNSNGNLSVTASTNVFPSATLKVNGGTIMKYNQPSFIQSHAAPYRAVPYGGRAYDFSYYPTKFYKR